MSASVLASVLLAIPVVALYLAIGARVLRRRRETGAGAFGHFALFWIGIGVYALAEAAWGALFLAGARDLTLGLVVLQVKIAASVAAFFGLVSYMVLVLTGRRRLLVPVRVFYALLFAATQAFYLWRGPLGQREGVWGLRLEYARTAVEPWWTMLLVALFVPPLLAALAYASLLAVARDPAQRRRIGLTALAFVGFFGPLLLGWMNGDWYWWGLVEKGIGFATGLAGLLASGRLAADEGTGRLAGLRAARASEREEALRERANELV